jgi:hypothetical protein
MTLKLRVYALVALIFVSCHAGARPLYSALNATQLFTQRYTVQYYSDGGWTNLAGTGGNVVLQPRFSYRVGQTETVLEKYAIWINDRNNPNNTFYIFLTGGIDSCMVTQVTAKNSLVNNTVGLMYEVAMEYVKLGTVEAQNANISHNYRVCSKSGVIDIRLFDPITSGIPIGIGSHVDGESGRVSETYLLLNTEGIIYPQ